MNQAEEEVCEHHAIQTESVPVAVGMSLADAAELFQVSKRSVTRAKVVIAMGIPELRRIVMAGKVAVSAAAVVANLPKEEQERVVTGGADAVIAASREIRQQRKATAQKPDCCESATSANSGALLPCGHCGSPAKNETFFDIWRGNLNYVTCTNDACGIQTPFQKSKEEALAIWNRRMTNRGVRSYDSLSGDDESNCAPVSFFAAFSKVIMSAP